MNNQHAPVSQIHDEIIVEHATIDHTGIPATFYEPSAVDRLAALTDPVIRKRVDLIDARNELYRRYEDMTDYAEIASI